MFCHRPTTRFGSAPPLRSVDQRKFDQLLIATRVHCRRTTASAISPLRADDKLRLLSRWTDLSTRKPMRTPLGPMTTTKDPAPACTGNPDACWILQAITRRNAKKTAFKGINEGWTSLPPRPLHNPPSRQPSPQRLAATAHYVNCRSPPNWSSAALVITWVASWY